MANETCPPTWMKLLICSRESEAVSAAARDQGEYLTHDQQRELIEMMEKYESKMAKCLEKYTKGWETL